MLLQGTFCLNDLHIPITLLFYRIYTRVRLLFGTYDKIQKKGATHLELPLIIKCISQQT